MRPAGIKRFYRTKSSTRFCRANDYFKRNSSPVRTIEGWFLQMIPKCAEIFFGTADTYRNNHVYTFKTNILYIYV